MGDWILHQLSRRPLWMNALMLFCIYMAVIYVPWDLFAKPVALDEEVWFGVRFHGVAAKLLAIPHWLVYALGAAGFWSLRSWMWPWAAFYVGQVAFAFFVWPLIYIGGFRGLVSGLVGGGLFFLLARQLWRARRFFEAEPTPASERYGGGWALVTGASAGIGAAFARSLAAQGMPVVLTARREDRLRAIADEIETAHGVETRVVAASLDEADGARAVLAAVDDLDVSVLVNNAGLGYAGRFDGQDADKLDALVQLNCAAPVRLTAALLPKIRERGLGAVIFTGSVAGMQPLPLHALYAATKAFDNLLGEALWSELRGSGVDVLVLEPGSTATEFQAVSGEIQHEGQAPEEVVATAFRALGHQPSVVAGAFNWLRSNAAMRLLPRGVLAVIARDVMAKQTPAHLQ